MSKIFLLILAIVAAFTLGAHAGSCPYKFQGGKDYDFSKIGTLTGTFFGKPAHLNFCQNVDKKLCPDGSSSICSPKSNPAGEDVSFATKSSTSAPTKNDYNPTTKISTVHESSGRVQCIFNKDYIPRKLAIHITCGSKTSDSFEIVSTDVACEFETTLTLKCSSDTEGLSGGAIFLIVFFSIFAGYFIIGFLICKFGLKKEGVLQSIPQYQFWCALPSFYIAGIKLTFTKLSSLCGKGPRQTPHQEHTSDYGATEEI